MAPKSTEDKIRDLIREELGSWKSESERKELEAKDPAERIRGIVREELRPLVEALAGKGKRREGHPDEEEEETDQGQTLGEWLKSLGARQ